MLRQAATKSPAALFARALGFRFAARDVRLQARDRRRREHTAGRGLRDCDGLVVLLQDRCHRLGEPFSSRVREEGCIGARCLRMSRRPGILEILRLARASAQYRQEEPSMTCFDPNRK